MKLKVAGWLWVASMFWWGSATGGAVAGISEEGEYTVFRTGGDEALLTLELSLAVPAWDRAPRLVFEFGFGTAEPEDPETFFDSFSVTLRNADRGATALLLTGDRYGVAWAPVTTAGLVVSLDDLRWEEEVFPDLAPAYEFRSAYAVSYTLPEVLAGGAADLYFDLFDNLNAFGSLAYVRNVRLESMPPLDAAVALESAVRVKGPYFEEAGAVVDPELQEVRLPRTAGLRFFRLCSDWVSELRLMSVAGERVRFRYGLAPPGLAVESAADAGGPYGPEEAEVAVLEQVLRVPVRSNVQFYRVRAEVPVRVEGIRVEGDKVVLEYGMEPRPVVLHSAAEAQGPYTDEGGVRVDAGGRMIEWGGGMRFYRLRSDVARRITHWERGMNEMVFRYE
jgi:hypothetical protein